MFYFEKSHLTKGSTIERAIQNVTIANQASFYVMLPNKEKCCWDWKTASERYGPCLNEGIAAELGRLDPNVYIYI